jgi:hypothetical protein
MDLMDQKRGIDQENNMIRVPFGKITVVVGKKDLKEQDQKPNDQLGVLHGKFR